MSIKLVALDLDGTLLDSNKNMPEDFLPWVRNHQNVKTVISSGRQYHTVIRDFPEDYNKLTIVAENGAIILDKNEIIHINAMSTENVKKCLDTVLEMPAATPVVCGVESAYMLHVPEEVYNHSGIFFAKLKMVDNLYEYIADDKILKVAVFFRNKDAEVFYHELCNIAVNIRASLSGDCWVDLANDDVSKGGAIETLQDIFKIKRSECAAFGDYLNDYTMLQACEESYCMANGHPDLKKIAKYIAPSNDEQGVMKVLNSNLFNTNICS